jgi:hypothetical protein
MELDKEKELRKMAENENVKLKEDHSKLKL